MGVALRDTLGVPVLGPVPLGVPVAGGLGVREVVVDCDGEEGGVVEGVPQADGDTVRVAVFEGVSLGDELSDRVEVREDDTLMLDVRVTEVVRDGVLDADEVGEAERDGVGVCVTQFVENTTSSRRTPCASGALPLPSVPRRHFS